MGLHVYRARGITESKCLEESDQDRGNGLWGQGLGKGNICDTCCPL